ncbi:hypothetical protein AAFN88_09930 [Pelagibius sp. CAU 1746]|uniref:hypothetical protein n=1 Tax=Pelagibius sp. CAU 1746 TaxID=3140370 RepID=UPI00325BB133
MRWLPLALSALTLLSAPAEALDCSRKAQDELTRLELGEDDIRSIRYVRKYNPNENGPDVLGVRAWVRLKACDSGYLVIDMTRTCFVRQSYTRGDCRLEDVTAY